MTLEILMATLNRSDIGFIDPSIIDQVKGSKRISLLVINQCTDIPADLQVENGRIRICSVLQTGLSNSRNMALKLAKEDVCLFMDDDCRLLPNSCETILKYHEKHSEAILTFQLKDIHSDRKLKSYLPFTFLNNKFTIGRISSCEISCKRKKILEKNIEFNTLFGLGAIYKRGEENIFLADCLNNKLKVRYIPALIASTPTVTTGSKLIADTGYTIGRVVRLMFKNYLSGLMYLTASNLLKFRNFSTREFYYYFKNLVRGYAG